MSTATFAMIPTWIMRSTLSANAIRLYGVLATYADAETREAFPSRATIARDMQLSQARSVDPYVEELVAFGALTVQRRQRPDGSYRSSLYTLAQKEPARSAAPDTPSDAPSTEGGSAPQRTRGSAPHCTVTRTNRTRTTEVSRSTTSIQVSRAATPHRTRAAEPKPTTQQRIARAAANDPVSPTWYHSTERQDLISRIQAIAAAKTAGNDAWDAEEAFWDALDGVLDAPVSDIQDQGWAPPRKATSKPAAAAWLNMLLAAWQAENGSLDYGQDQAA